MRGPRGIVLVPPVSPTVELADDLRGAVLLLVGVHLVAAVQTECAEGRFVFAYGELVAHDATEEFVQPVVAADATDVRSEDHASQDWPEGHQLFTR